MRQVNAIMGTAAELTALNMTLYDNQIAYETDTGNIKIGDGLTVWTALGYSPAKLGSSDRKSTRLNSSHIQKSRMPSSA